MANRDVANWIVCLGGEDWWYHSHAHFDIQVMKRFAEKVRVLYVCSIGMRMPSLRRDALFWTRVNRKLKSVSRMLRRIKPQLYVYSPLPIPLYQHSFGRALNAVVLRTQLRAVYLRLGIRSPLVWVNTPTAWPVVAPLPKRALVYQRTDDYRAYDFPNFNADYVRSIDDELVRIGDIVLHVSDELHQEAQGITTRSVLLPQGVDERFFDCRAPQPLDLASIPRPIIGYIGGMDRHKFDTPLVVEVARALPTCSFVLVGAPNPNVDALRELPNVHFLGVKRHEEIPAYVHGFDVCMLPTARTDWGVKCRPLKLLEYLAAGKPIVATPTPASSSYADVAFIAGDVSSWVAAIQGIIHDEAGLPKPALAVANRLTTWNTLANELWAELEAAGLVGAAPFRST
jgi:glycosyltransferase involved in cell wall biosynthesis